jgi:hypothetical protein
MLDSLDLLDKSALNPTRTGARVAQPVTNHSAPMSPPAQITRAIRINFMVSCLIYIILNYWVCPFYHHYFFAVLDGFRTYKNANQHLFGFY